MKVVNLQAYTKKHAHFHDGLKTYQGMKDELRPLIATCKYPSENADSYPKRKPTSVINALHVLCYRFCSQVHDVGQLRGINRVFKVWIGHDGSVG